MSVIAGKSVRVQTMSDGTLRLTVDIPPYKASEAFGLFGAPGVDVALAKLELEKYQDITEQEPENTEAKRDSKLSRLAAMFCNNAKFWQFLLEFNTANEDFECFSSDEAKEFMYGYCDIESRSKLDDPTRPDAIFKFHELRKAFSEWNTNNL